MKLALFVLGVCAFVAGGVFVMWVSGAFDEVHQRYESKKQAQADRLFERGWLPHFIPESSRNISMVNNLDINTTMGSFDFDPLELDLFVRSVQQANDGLVRVGSYREKEGELNRNGYLIFDCSFGEGAWKFLIHPRGHCEFWGSSNDGVLSKKSEKENKAENLKSIESDESEVD